MIATDLTLPQETANKLGPAASAFQLDVTQEEQNLVPVVADDEEAIQNAKRDRRYREEARGSIASR